MVAIAVTFIIAITIYICLPRIPTSFTITFNKRLHIDEPAQPERMANEPKQPAQPEPKAEDTTSLLQEINGILTTFNGGIDE